MTSNALSPRRGPLRRPKVCRESHNPGRCDPDPPTEHVITCNLEPDGESVEFEGSIGIYVVATDDSYPEDQVVGCVCSASAGSFACQNPVLNGMEDFGEFEAPGEPGSHTLTAVFTWPDAHTCTAETSVTEEEEPE